MDREKLRRKMGSIYDINWCDCELFHIDFLPVSNYVYFMTW